MDHRAIIQRGCKHEGSKGCEGARVQGCEAAPSHVPAMHQAYDTGTCHNTGSTTHLALVLPQPQVGASGVQQVVQHLGCHERKMPTVSNHAMPPEEPAAPCKRAGTAISSLIFHRQAAAPRCRSPSWTGAAGTPCWACARCSGTPAQMSTHQGSIRSRAEQLGSLLARQCILSASPGHSALHAPMHC